MLGAISPFTTVLNTFFDTKLIRVSIRDFIIYGLGIAIMIHKPADGG
jgi:hypothetical protein